MSERPRCLVPDLIENQPVDALLEGQRTPLLVRIISACDRYRWKVDTYIDEKTAFMKTLSNRNVNSKETCDTCHSRGNLTSDF